MIRFWAVLLCFTCIEAVLLAQGRVSRQGFHFKGLESRIFNGIKANSGQFPWQTAIFNKIVDAENFMCGGSLINKQWILTAAHCLMGVKPVVVLGSTSLFKDPSKSRRVFYFNLESYVHPYVCYPNNTRLPLSEMKSLSNNIALIKLPKPVDDGKYIKSITLIDKELPSGSTVYASGWGMTNPPEFFSSYSDNLLFANMTTVSNIKCDQAPGYSPGYLCAEGVQETCNRDTGGPLLYYNATDTPFLVGVTNSYRRGQTDEKPELTCKYKVPGQVFEFFVDVYKHKGWIEKIMKMKFCKFALKL